MGKTHSVNGTPLIPDAPAIPCGIIAKSIFNDTFTLYNKYPNLKEPEQNQVAITLTQIA